ncbi:MAG: hypothetical protein SPI77_08700 [Corynebacterium sp.]|nr:hypothetical protein [Corynebacterium sp.]
MEQGMKTQLKVPLLVGIIAAFTGLVTQIASRRPFAPSLLLNITEGDPISSLVKQVDPSFQFSPGADHYDGTYLWAMAADPFALGEAHNLIDLAGYRYGHPLYAWIGGLLAFGQKGLFDHSFWLLSIVSIFAAGFFISQLAIQLGVSGWWGLIVAASPGLLFSVSTDLTESFQAALIAGFLLAWVRGRSPVVIAVLGIALCLTKEQLILVPCAVGLALIVEMIRDRKLYIGDVLSLLPGPVMLAVWLIFVRSQFSADQLTYDAGNIGVPLKGWGEIFTIASSMRGGDMNTSQIGSTVAPVLMALAVVMLTGLVVGLDRRDVIGWFVVTQALLISGLGWRTLMYPHEMYRIPAVAVTFTVLLIAVTLTHGREAPRLWRRDGSVMPTLTTDVR